MKSSGKPAPRAPAGLQKRLLAGILILCAAAMVVVYALVLVRTKLR